MSKKTEKPSWAGVIVICILAALLTFGGPFIFIAMTALSGPPSNPHTAAQRQLDRNYDNLVVVRDYLAGLPYESITIRNTTERGMMSVSGRGVEISDTAVSDAIRALFRRGFRTIQRSGNSIIFQRWVRFRNAGMGITYGIGYAPIDNSTITFLTLLVPLDTQNGGRWYYYEADFNVYRQRRNQALHDDVLSASSCSTAYETHELKPNHNADGCDETYTYEIDAHEEIDILEEIEACMADAANCNLDGIIWMPHDSLNNRAYRFFREQLYCELYAMQAHTYYRTNGTAELFYLIYDKERIGFYGHPDTAYFFMVRLGQRWPDSDGTELPQRVTTSWFAIDENVENVYFVHFSRSELLTLDEWRASEFFTGAVQDGDCD